MTHNKSNKSDKNEKLSIGQTVYDVFLHNPYKSYNFRQLSFEIGVADKSGKTRVKDILFKLASQKKIVEEKRGKFKLNPSQAGKEGSKLIMTGIVDMKGTGKAYIITDDLGEDIFIASNNTSVALDGDKVKVRLFPKRKGRKTEGQIIEVLERSRVQFAGIVEISTKYAFVLPDDNNVPVDFFIPESKLKNAKNGEKVVVRITDWPPHSKNPFGEIIKVLGKPGEHEVEMQSILADSGFPVQFPAQVETEARKIDSGITPEEISRRRDYRQVFTCTVDPEDAKDFDDALSLKKLPNGNWEVGVHIADVSFYVKPGSALDNEAYERATSVYMVDRVIPMLPEHLSNDICSLKPHTDKLCYAAIFELDEQAKVLNEWFGHTVICSNRRYNYDEVQAVIEGGSDEFQQEILVLHNLALKIREDRFKRGAIAFSSQEVKFKLDENGKPIETYIKETKDSNRLIEDFMLLANRKVAERIGRKHGKQNPNTFVYRIHDMPNPEKLQTFAEFVKKLGYTIQTASQNTISSSLNKLFEQIKGKGEENMIEAIAIRTMAKAEYSTQNIGHYGLAFTYYTHFTSPIRRYPDLMVHRLLDRYLKGGASVNPAEYEVYCKQCSEKERKAMQAERASVKYKQAEYLLDKIGMEFNGVISGVSKWGIYVELEGNKCEGMVSLRYLDDDFYYLDEDNYKVEGAQFGKEYKLGDQVRIQVIKIDLAKKQMDFKMV